MVLESNKEVQNQYYFSYPKPPILDVKEENRDIIVAERANIKKVPLLQNEDEEKTFHG